LTPVGAQVQWYVFLVDPLHGVGIFCSGNTCTPTLQEKKKTVWQCGGPVAGKSSATSSVVTCRTAEDYSTVKLSPLSQLSGTQVGIEESLYDHNNHCNQWRI